MPSAYPHVVKPGMIGSCTIRNRIYISAQTTSFATGGVPNGRHIAYLSERVRGGAGLVFTEAVDVLQDDRFEQSPLRLAFHRDEDIPHYASFVSALQQEGGKVFIQLTQTGHSRFWAPSPVGVDERDPAPREIPSEELFDLRDAFVAAARRAVKAGFDGIEVHFGHGHLLHRFLSSHLNRRKDGYGSSPEERLRFPMEVLASVRRALGKEFPVGLRVSTDDLGGLGPDEHAMIEILQEVVASGLADFLDISQGGANTSSAQVPDMTFDEAPFIAMTRRVLAELPPVVALTTGRFTSLATAEKVLAEGDISFIGMTRAHTADPEVMAKTLRGDVAHVRPCVACNFCADTAIFNGGGLACMVNPRAGQENRWPTLRSGLSESGKRIVVVGGGPAGLEFARVAAERGHNVSLHERATELGGQLRLAASSATRNDFTKLTTYFERELDLLGVSIHTGHEMTKGAISSLSPDLVVLATGAVPPTKMVSHGGFIPDFSSAAESLELDGHVCLIDDENAWRTVAAIESWMERGAGRLTVVTRAGEFLAGVSAGFVRPPLFKRLEHFDVRVRTSEVPVEVVDNGRITVRNALTGVVSAIEDIDHLLAVGNWHSNGALASQLTDARFRVETIGDAFITGTVLDATAAAHALAMTT